MLIALPNGSTLALNCSSTSAGGALTVTAPGGVAKPVAFGQQLRALLAPLGDDAARVHMDTLRAWCRIALDRDSRQGCKANRRNRDNWHRSLLVLETALASEQPAAVREVA